MNDSSAACVCGEINARHCPVHGQGESAATVPRWRLIWNRLQAKLHHAYPCRRCGFAYNCPDGECHS